MEILPPVRGVHKGSIVGHSPELTTQKMNNVRPRDCYEKRVRIGQRPGLDKWGAGTLVGGSNQPVVSMIVVSSVI